MISDLQPYQKDSNCKWMKWKMKGKIATCQKHLAAQVCKNAE